MLNVDDRLKLYEKQGFFGKYHIDGTPRDAFLGNGSFGSVYRLRCVEVDARGHRDEYTRAVKLIAIDADHIRNKKAGNVQTLLDAQRRKVHNEIHVMRKLGQETGIAFFFDSREIKRTDTPENSWDVLIVMEELEVLPAYLQRAGIVPGTTANMRAALHVWMEISSALRVCELRQVLHLDVKPDNIFHSAGDHYKLSDFGTAIEKPTFPEGTLRGTHDYMAPEMYKRLGGDIRADIYSLGVTIYEMLNGGRLPFQADLGKNTDVPLRARRDEANRLRMEEQKAVQPIRGVPQDINDLLLSCLQADPAKRCADCEELYRNVLVLYARYCARRGSETGQGSKTKIILGAAAVVGVLGLGSVVLMLNSGSKPSAEPVAVIETAAPTEAPTEAPTAEPTAEPTATPTAEPADDGSISGASSKEGILEMQQKLVLVGALDEANGEYDTDTIVAVRDFRNWAEEYNEGVELPDSTECDELTLKYLDAAVKEGVSIREATPTPSPAPSPTPSPTPTVAPTAVPQLGLTDLSCNAEGDSVTISGKLLCDAGLSTSDLKLSVNGSGVNAENVSWMADDGGYIFSAGIRMDVTDIDELPLRVSVNGMDGITPAEGAVAVTREAVEAEPTESIEQVGIHADDNQTLCYINAQSATTQTFTGTATPDSSIQLLVNGEHQGNFVVEPDGTFAVEVQTSKLNADEQNTVAVAYPGHDVAAEWQVYYDPNPPQISCDALLSADTSMIEVHEANGEAGVTMTLYVNGKATDIADTTGPDGSAYLTDIDTLSLTRKDSVTLVAADEAGNTNERPLNFEAVKALTFDVSAGRLSVSGEPNATVDLSVNGSSISMSLDADGEAELDLTNLLSVGENTVSVAYVSDSDNGFGDDVPEAPEAQTVTVTDDAPTVSVDPDRIIPGLTCIDITIDDDRDSSLTLEMIANGETFRTYESMEVGTHEGIELETPPGLHFDDRITLRVTDSSGRIGEATMTYAIVRGLSLSNSDGTTVEVEGEPIAKVLISINNEEVTSLTLGADGTGSIDLTEYLTQGSNTVSCYYSGDNGFADNTPEMPDPLTIEFDGEAPEISVSPTKITRDTEEITLSVSGEDKECTWELSVNGEAVDNGTVKPDGSVNIPVPDLQESDEICLYVWDDFGNTADEYLTYENTSDRSMTYAWTDGGDITAAVGQTADLTVYLLCNSKNIGYTKIWLGDTSVPDFEREELSGAEREGMIEELGLSGKVDTGYADTLFKITDIKIPDRMSADTYSLTVEVGTEEGFEDWLVAEVTVEASAQAAGRDYVDAATKYAIGFDAPVQSSFRPDDVLLSGWICRQAGADNGLGTYKLLDSGGVKVASGIFSETEHSLYDRGNTDALTQGKISGSDSSNAGFIFTPDWSNVDDGNYTLQIYNESGQPTASIPLTIDSHAGSVPESTQSDILDSWGVTPEASAQDYAVGSS